MVGSLMYAMIGTRPDIVQAVSTLSRFLAKPKKVHENLLIQVFHYLQSNPSYTPRYESNGNVNLEGFVDAAYANTIGYKSTTGYSFLLGKCLVSWYSGRQSVVTQSSAEADSKTVVLE